MSKAPMAALALVWFLGVLAFGGGVVGDRQLPSIVRQAIFVVDWSEPAISNVVTIKNVFPKEIYSTYKYQIAARHVLHYVVNIVCADRKSNGFYRSGTYYGGGFMRRNDRQVIFVRAHLKRGRIVLQGGFNGPSEINRWRLAKIPNGDENIEGIRKVFRVHDLRPNNGQISAHLGLPNFSRCNHSPSIGCQSGNQEWYGYEANPAESPRPPRHGLLREKIATFPVIRWGISFFAGFFGVLLAVLAGISIVRDRGTKYQRILGGALIIPGYALWFFGAWLAF